MDAQRSCLEAPSSLLLRYLGIRRLMAVLGMWLTLGAAAWTMTDVAFTSALATSTPTTWSEVDWSALSQFDDAGDLENGRWEPTSDDDPGPTANSHDDLPTSRHPFALLLPGELGTPSAVDRPRLALLSRARHEPAQPRAPPVS